MWLMLVCLAVKDLSPLAWSEAYLAEASTDPSTLFTDGVLDKRGWEPCVDDVQRLRCWRYDLLNPHLRWFQAPIGNFTLDVRI